MMKKKLFILLRHAVKHVLAVCFLLFLLSGCIPDDYSGCPSRDEGDISITIGLGDSIPDSGQETEIP